MKFLLNAGTVLCGIVTQLNGATVPSELSSTLFAGPDKAPCPAVICSSPYGEVYVGVDKQGSLGKKANLGSIVRLVDKDNDGKADQVTTYATIDNPRGLIAIGDRLIVLHCTQKDGKPYNQQISVFTDKDKDGVADGPLKPLVTGIGNPKYIQSRGADHCTNNIRLGIDGWIYVSVGDFGFVNAQGTDGKTLTMHGGGIVRVRPDGSELETFIHGTRNVYDVAIDPFMNVFTRENTNDGVGWWVRFSHYIQTGEYGYPSLYTNFPEDMLPALGEYGSGSGTGCLFLQEPSWPSKYNNQPLMADWGKSKVFIHKVSPDGASFTNTPENFFGSAQVADLDIDGSGRMYVAAWAGAGYSGNPKKGYVDRIVPKGWKYKPFPNLPKLAAKDLVNLIYSDSITTRTYASQEILRRGSNDQVVKLLLSITKDKTKLLESRVAAIYTLAQLQGSKALPTLEALYALPELREHAIRAMGDRQKIAQQASLKLLQKALTDPNPRVQVAAAVALGRTGKKDAAEALLAVAMPPVSKTKEAKDKPAFRSDPIANLKDKATINVDISNFKDLYLIIDPAGENANDHAAWINPTVTTKDGKKIDLTKTRWMKATQDWGKALVNKDTIGKPLGKGVKGIGTHSASTIQFKIPSNAKTFTATGIMTQGSKNKGKVAFIVSDKPLKIESAGKPHSTPNSKAILPHIARQALLALDAQDACISALKSDQKNSVAAALATMKFMHSEKIVEALIKHAKSTTGDSHQAAINTLIRLHQKENQYDGSTWWKTRPDPHGPYYFPVDWKGSATISNFLTAYIAKLNDEQKQATINELKRNRAYVPAYNPRPGGKKIAVKKIGTTSIEDIVLYLQKKKGRASNGQKVINKVGCVGCHNITAKGTIKGPDLAKLGNMKKADLAEAIIKPAATIAKSWVTITLKDGSTHMGTIVRKDAHQIVLHNIGGIPEKIDTKQIKSTAPGMNMMSVHLCDDLTLPEFADLVEYIQSIDPSRKK